MCLVLAGIWMPTLAACPMCRLHCHHQCCVMSVCVMSLQACTRTRAACLDRHPESCVICVCDVFAGMYSDASGMTGTSMPHMMPMEQQMPMHAYQCPGGVGSPALLPGDVLGSGNIMWADVNPPMDVTSGIMSPPPNMQPPGPHGPGGSPHGQGNSAEISLQESKMLQVKRLFRFAQFLVPLFASGCDVGVSVSMSVYLSMCLVGCGGDAGYLRECWTDFRFIRLELWQI
jgi:hypothetical protein